MMTELAVLVPVLNRPANVAPLVESFLAGCPDDAQLHFIVSDGDKAEWDAADRETRGYLRMKVYSSPSANTWPEKINLAVNYLYRADWFLCAADDITFTPGWWEATAELRADPHICVIGTHDSADGTGNPRVAGWTHTCHPLIRASYIRDFGTWDEPGKAVHDAYSHWFVDDELVNTAKMRRAWAFCPEAVLEHLHPYWGKGQWDETYTLGESNAEADKQLWFKRSAQFGPLQPYPEDDLRCPR